MTNIPNIDFNKVTDKDNTLFNQTQYYEGNFDKINQQVVPKINELDNSMGAAEGRLDLAEADLDDHEGRIGDVELGKVDKVAGKQLSTEDFTTEEKTKLNVDIPAQLAEKVKPEKTTFFNLSKNLFDKSKVTEEVINEVTGVISPSDIYWFSDYTQVNGGEVYSLTKGYRVGYYDADKTFISGANLVGVVGVSITTPANAKYIRFAIHKTSADINTYMFVEGNVLPASYESFGAFTLSKDNQEKQTGLGRENLDNSFLLGIDITSGTDINTIINDGVYTGIANGNYTNLPKGFATGNAFRLSVSNLFKNGNRWVIQDFTDFSNPDKRWSKVIDRNGVLLNDWVAVNKNRSFENKVIACFGDSTTEFGNIDTRIANKTGATAHNLGFGGTRMGQSPSAYYNPFCFSNLVDAIVSGDFSAQQAQIDNANNPFSTKFKTNFSVLKTLNFNNIDFVTLWYGTNDYMGTLNERVALGTDSDLDKSTFYGALQYSIDKLLSAFPHLRVVLVTPTWRENSPSITTGEVDLTPNPDGKFLVEYVDAIISRANKFHIASLDLFRCSGINKYSKSIFLADTVHPNADGFNYLGDKIGTYLSSIY